MHDMTRSRGLRIGLLAIAVALAASMLVVSPASAHNTLVASTPESGQVLTELPAQFSVTTNEAMLALPGSQGFALQIQDAAGAYYGDGCVEIADATMSATAALGDPGEYTMLWQAVSSDGHSIDGAIPFTWAPTEEVASSQSFATPPVCGQAPTETPSASPVPTTNAPAASDEPTAVPDAASGIDLAAVLWIGGALLAVGIAVAIAISIAGRRKPTG